MPIRLGIDFGTATTCAAVVRDFSTLRVDTIALDGLTDLSETKVFLDAVHHNTELIHSRSIHNRHPLSTFAKASTDFDQYWSKRRLAYSDSLTRFQWNEARRELGLLLSFFKPELSDVTRVREQRIAVRTHSTYDPLAQSENFTTYYDWRRIAEPDPDTDDLVAATAAILRQVVSTAVSAYGQPVESIVIGVPSDSAGDLSGARERAVRRREEAIQLAGINQGLATADCRLTFVSEAEAAGFGLRLDGLSQGSPCHLIIVDVGAGTTDLALVRMEPRGAVLRPQEVLLQDSVRQAGRNVNEILAEYCTAVREFRDARSAMDERALQVYVDVVVEKLKREIGEDTREHRLRFDQIAAHYEGCDYDSAKRRALLRTAYVDIGTKHPDLVALFERRFTEWFGILRRFLLRSTTLLRSEVARYPLSVAVVGGGARCPLIHRAIERIASEESASIPVTFDDHQGDAQRVVARGLARRAALMD